MLCTLVYAAKLHTDRLVSLDYAAANSLNAGIESAATVDIIKDIHFVVSPVSTAGCQDTKFSYLG